MSSNFRTRDRLPFNFIDGIAIQGIDISHLKDLENPTGSTMIGHNAGTVADKLSDIDDNINEIIEQKANINDPVFTGNPQVPTPPAESEDESIASTAFVKSVARTSTADGVIVTSDQTIDGTKTFLDPIVGNLQGNSSSATKLASARSIGGVDFDGTADIDLPGVNQPGNQNTTGTAENAKNLTSGRVLAQSGSALEPSIGFASDGARDTGFYWVGDGRIGIATNGQARGEVDAGGMLSLPAFNGRGAARLQGIIDGGAWAISAQGSGITISLVATGHYRVFHNLNTLNYVPMVTIVMPMDYNNSPNINTRTVSVVDKQSTYFDIQSANFTSYLVQGGGNDNNQYQYFVRTLANIGQIYFTVHTI